jgi:hypothetical protein
MECRLHQSIVMATQPWWELLPVSWALRLQMSRIWVGLKTVWLLASAALVWCLSLRKRWRSAVLVASAGAWLYSGQKDLGEISWSAGQVRAPSGARRSCTAAPVYRSTGGKEVTKGEEGLGSSRGRSDNAQRRVASTQPNCWSHSGSNTGAVSRSGGRECAFELVGCVAPHHARLSVHPSPSLRSPMAGAQAAVALCVWSVTTFWGLVFTPVALAIVGLMYWDEIEVRMRQWRQSVARVVRWRQRRSASSKEAKATKAATFKTSNKAKRTDKQSPVSAPSGDSPLKAKLGIGPRFCGWEMVVGALADAWTRESRRFRSCGHPS